MRSDDRTGFALPAVLAITGVVTLIFLVAITALATLTAEAASARARVRFIERALTLEAQVAWIATTEPLEPRGFAVGAPRRSASFDLEGGEVATIPGSSLTEVRLDGRVYRAEVGAPLSVALQDQAGLVNLSLINDKAYHRLVALTGAPGSGGGDFRARFVDYTDPDDLEQPNGAERSRYDDAVPANRTLLRPSEWLSVLGLREAVNGPQWRALRDDLATDTTQIVGNVNTMTPLAMQVLLNLTEGQAQAAVQARETRTFTSLEEFAATAGANLISDAEILYTTPSGRLVMTIRDAQSPWVYRGRLTLTPGGVEQPFWIDQTELLEAPGRAVADVSDADRLPYTPR